MKTARGNVFHFFSQTANRKSNAEILASLKESKVLGISFKIFLNYIQTVSIVASFNMKWPIYARSFFNAQSGVGTFSTQLFSLDCFARG